MEQNSHVTSIAPLAVIASSGSSAKVLTVACTRTLEQVLTVERRSDLPGNPLKWEVALGNLLAGLGADPAGRRVP